MKCAKLSGSVSLLLYLCGMKDYVAEMHLHTPAKVNLMLSVHGQRADGFHALTSLVVSLAFGDELKVRLLDGAKSDRLNCNDANVPTGTDNLILKAARLFRVRLGRTVFFEFDLEKLIPMGAGLGGGSSNASSALLAMNRLCGGPLSTFVLLELAAELGSDCPFFIDPQPSLISGRGEIINAVDPELAKRLCGQSVVLFRPPFAINTAWAYAQLAAAAPASYEAPELAAKRLESIMKSGTELPSRLLYNSFEAVVGRKYLALPSLLSSLRELGVPCLMSGSGSCCFALLEQAAIPTAQLQELCYNALGEAAFWIETEIC